MKQISTLFLRGAVVALGAVILAICVFALPEAIASDNTGDYLPILLGLYVPAIPFFFALYQTMRLLGIIDKNKAFSEASLIALRKIKYCAVAISAWFSASMPYVFYVADNDDAPGVIVLAMVIIFASVVVAVFAAVLQKLLRSAMDIQTENDLTV